MQIMWSTARINDSILQPVRVGPTAGADLLEVKHTPWLVDFLLKRLQKEEYLRFLYGVEKKDKPQCTRRSPCQDTKIQCGNTIE